MNGIQRLMAVMVERACDSVVTISYAHISELSGVHLRHIGLFLRRMRAGGAIEVVDPAGRPISYRVLRPEFAGASREIWTVERVAALTARYPTKFNAPLLADLNALPGLPVTMQAGAIVVLAGVRR